MGDHALQSRQVELLQHMDRCIDRHVLARPASFAESGSDREVVSINPAHFTELSSDRAVVTPNPVVFTEIVSEKPIVTSGSYSPHRPISLRPQHLPEFYSHCHQNSSDASEMDGAKKLSLSRKSEDTEAHGAVVAAVSETSGPSDGSERFDYDSG